DLTHPTPPRQRNGSPLPGNGEELVPSRLAVPGGAIRADDHFLDDLLALAARIIRLDLFAFCRLIGAQERVGLGTKRVPLAAPFKDQAGAGSRGRHDTPTQLTAEHGDEPMDRPSGRLMSRKGCTPHWG